MGTDQLETPVVMIHEDIMESNIERVQQFCDRMGYQFRPHIKTHKIPELAKRQIAKGAIGITCQKLGEAEVMADNGIEDILLYYNVLGESKLRRLSALSQRIKMTVAIDAELVAQNMSRALQSHGGKVNILIDCNTGYNRTGVRTPKEALELARIILKLPNLHLAGFSTFPYLSQTTSWFEEAVSLFKHEGILIETISVGGSGFPKFSDERIPFVTEYRAGTSVFNDRTCVLNGWASYDQCAERVLSTVISVTNENMVILDAGSKTLTSDIRPGMTGYGYIIEYPDATIEQLSEEHGHVNVSQCRKKPTLGEQVTIIPNHACGTMNLHDWVYRVSSTSMSTLTEEHRWNVAARGKVR